MNDTLGPFCRQLVRLVRAADSYGLYDGKADTELLAPFIVDKAKAREIPLIGDPDPKLITRLGQFYAAVSLAIESRCGLIAAPLMNISPEGFGRVVLICGRLVVVSKILRDVHRFGFASLERLEATGSKLVDEGCQWIDRFKDSATAE